MRYNITGRNLTVTPSLKNVITDKLGKLDKYFKEDVEARVCLSVQKDEQKIEVTIPGKHFTIRAEESNPDMYTAIDLVVDVIERQLIKHKNKLIDRKQNAVPFSDLFIEEESDYDDEEIKISKIKTFDFKPMDKIEACLQMDMLGHDFFVFVDAQTSNTCVVYKRKNGGYGLIEPEV